MVAFKSQVACARVLTKIIEWNGEIFSVMLLKR